MSDIAGRAPDARPAQRRVRFAPGGLLVSGRAQQAGDAKPAVEVGIGDEAVDASTPAQIARGAFSNDNWYLGFNIARKFY